MKIKIKIWFKNGTYAEVVEEVKENAADIAEWFLDMSENSALRIGCLVVKMAEIAAVQFIDLQEEQGNDTDA